MLTQMNQLLLDTLMHLFAIIAREDGIEQEERQIVKGYLENQLTAELAHQYILVFDRYAKQPPVANELEKVAKAVNKELKTPQKFFILMRLAELVMADEQITLQEQEGINIVARCFGIPEHDYADLYAFITTRDARELKRGRVLIISEESLSDHAIHYPIEHLIGYVAVLYIPTGNLLLMRHCGNGEVRLNGRLLPPGQDQLLSSGAVIREPRSQPIYYSELIECFLKPHRKHLLQFEVQDVEYVFPTGDRGLNPVSLSEEEGRLIAIMGASGAGKSTLVNVLNGTYTPTNGTVEVNGINLHEDPDALKGIIGYVSQDDLLIEELTVYENLYFNAELCFANKSQAELQALVDATLENLGLLEIKHLRVGSPLNQKISGGQRKRLNIALELIREPAILFVDEPTSGLSSRDSENVMDLLRQLTRHGKLIYVVIHQPSSDIFKLFDSLVIMDTGGYQIYYGNPLGAVTYFKEQVDHVNAEEAECPTCGNVNPEQIFDIIETRVVDEYGEQTPERKIKPKEWHARYRVYQKPAQQAPDADETPQSNLKIANKLQQFWVFTKRDVLSKLANTSYLAINFLEAPVLAGLLAYVLRYYDSTADRGYTLYHNPNLPIWMFVSILVALFLGLTVSAEEILRDRKIRKREQFLHLSDTSYLLSKSLIMVIISAIQMLTFVVIGNAIIGIEWAMTPYYWLILFSTAVFANMLGLNISATFNNAVTIYILVPILLIPQIILSGAIVRFDRLNPDIVRLDRVPLYGEAMTSRWAFEALAVKQFKSNAYNKHFYDIDRKSSQSRFKLYFWLPEMRTEIRKASQLLRSDGRDSDELKALLKRVRFELAAELSNFAGVDMGFVKQMQPETYNPGMGVKALEILKAVENNYRKKFKASKAKHDAILRELKAKGVNIDSLRLHHDNEALEELVKNTVTARKIAPEGPRLIQLMDPIYKSPGAHKGPLAFRDQLHVPEKQLFGLHIPTFWFDFAFIWLLSLVLYITLYFETFRWVVARFGKLSQLNWFKRKE